MVNLSTAVSMGSLFLTAQSLSEKQQRQRQADQSLSDRGENADGVPPQQAAQNATNDKLDRLIENQNKTQPTAHDKDAYASAVLELQNGEVGNVVYEPAAGWHLRVQEVHFDRRVDHEYEINVGGDVTSVSHRAKYSSPRVVTQSDRITATAINESGGDSVLDFEIIGWAERPPSDGVK